MVAFLELSRTLCYCGRRECLEAPYALMREHMPRKTQPSAILGDVVAREDVTVNTKGGSMTATLKKPLREKLGELGTSLSGAAVEFASGQAVVLLSRVPGAANADLPVRVRKVGLNRFEIGIESDDDEEVDEVTAAFLRLK